MVKILSAFLLIFVLSGCAGQNNEQGMNNNNGNRPDPVNFNDGNNGQLNQRQTNNAIGQGNGNGIENNENQDQNQMEVSEEAADRVSELEEVQQANVLTTDNNAFVAVLLEGDQNDQVSDEIKEKISQKVKEANPDIDNVNVSTNPDFAQRVQEYGEAIENGDPIEGLFDQMGEAIQRVFPDAE